MKCFPNVIISSVLFTAVMFATLTPASTYVIGGELNTQLSFLIAPNWIKDVISTLKSSHSDSLSSKPARSASTKNYPNDIFEVIATKHEPAPPVLVHKFWEDTGVKVQTQVISSLEEANPFLRAKRQAISSSQCQISENLPQTVQELNSYLNASQFLGLNPNASSQESGSLPVDQPEVCPASQADWWPGPTLNLRSNCPWIYEEKDLGEHAFPRYLRSAKCLCTKCIGNEASGCQELKQEVTVMRRTGCKGSVAAMTKEKLKVVVGCTCVSPVQQTTTPSPEGYGPPLNNE